MTLLCLINLFIVTVWSSHAFHSLNFLMRNQASQINFHSLDLIILGY